MKLEISRPEMEIKLTALLLGELPDDEAAAVREAIAADPELSNLHAQLAAAIPLVREAAGARERREGIEPPLRFSAERRQQLLQKLNPPLKPLPEARPGHVPWFIPMSIAAVLVVMIGSIALLPTFSSRRPSAAGASIQRPELLVKLSEVKLRRDLGEALPKDNKAKLIESDHAESPGLLDSLASKPPSVPGALPALDTAAGAAKEREEVARFKSSAAPEVAEGFNDQWSMQPRTASPVLRGSLAGEERSRLAGRSDSPAEMPSQSMRDLARPLSTTSVLGDSPLLGHRFQNQAQGAKPLAKTEVDPAPALKPSDALGLSAHFEPAESGSNNRPASARQPDSLADGYFGVMKIDEGKKVKVAGPLPVLQPEFLVKENPISTFSLNVTDVSFKLAAASLEKGLRPDPAGIRGEEFLNAFDYGDPEPSPGSAVAFAWERARSPIEQDRDLLRFSIKTASRSRPAGQALRLVLLLDRSGSMERADRIAIVQEAMRVLTRQLRPEDKLSVVTFARTARLWADAVAGDQAARALDEAAAMPPEGGTNLEEALKTAYENALKNYLRGGINRVVLLTDGAANLGNVNPEALKERVEAHRRQGIALDCFGIGWEGFNDDLLQVLSSHGDGRYGFLNSPEEAASHFGTQLAGALEVAAADVKVQVEFNPNRVAAYRQVGYSTHQLSPEQFRDNTVDAAEIGAAESGNALYVVQLISNGDGPVGTVRVRYRNPATAENKEEAWSVPFTGSALALAQAPPSMRLAGVATGLAEWLAGSPHADGTTPDSLLQLLHGVPESFGADPRPKQLEWMVRQAQSLGK